MTTPAPPAQSDVDRHVHAFDPDTGDEWCEACEERGAQRERKRLRALVDAAKTLATFMRAPDYDSAGKPADWTPGLDAIGDFYAAVDALGPQP
jgi:hypothetical protein